MSQVTVEGLEAQLEELIDLVQTLTDRQDERIERLEASLAELRVGRDGAQPHPATRESHARPWTARATLAQWRELADWVDWLQSCYQPQGEYRVPPCWPWHPGAAEELAGLYASWKTAMRTAEESQDNGDQALYWHDRYLWDTLIRANRVIPNACRNTGHVQPKALPPTDRTGWPQDAGQPADA